MIKFIFGSTANADMQYAVKSRTTSPFFYLEIGKKKIAFLKKNDLKGLTLGNPDVTSGGKRSNLEIIALEPFIEEAKLSKAETTDRNKLAYAIFKKYGLFRKKVAVPSHFPLDMADFLRARGAKLIPTYPLFPERAVKTRKEIEHIKTCLAHTKSAFRAIENILSASKIKKNKIYFKNKILTSEFLKQEVEKILADRGMFDLLGMIISTGKQTATPHHEGSGPILPHQPIVCDIFPRHRATHFYADMTRTYCKGKPSPELAKMFAAVLKVQKETFKKIRAGMPAKKLQQNAAELFGKMGYDVGEVGFVHGLGHGVGLDIHEKPSIRANSEDILQAGNVITVEPGLYYPKMGLARRTRQLAGKAAGIRIEDMVLVTKTGCQNLTNYPKKFVIP